MNTLTSTMNPPTGAVNLPEARDANILYSETFLAGSDKDWVVLVHGAGGSIRTWKYQLDVLKPHFNVLVMDLRDHGNSQDLPVLPIKEYSFELMARDIGLLLDSKGIAKAHFIGVSMGTIVIRWIESLYPDRVQSIVFAGGVFRLNFTLNAGVKLGVVVSKILPWHKLSRFLSFLVMPRKNHKKARGIFLREADRIDPNAFKKWMHIVKTVGAELNRFFKKELEVPMLVVMGSQDYVFLPPARKYEKLHDLAQMEVLHGCGHVCNIEGAKQFNPLMVDFLRRVSQ